jgi:hypothetical protein
MMHFDATQILIFGSFGAFALWVWRFSSVLRKTPREMRAAALRGSAKAMGSEFWEQGNLYEKELAEEFTIGASTIVHTLQWPNPQVQIFSFQEVRHGAKGRRYFLNWVGYRFCDRSFPRFDLRLTSTVSFLRRGWWRKISLPGQVEFESRFTLTGENRPLLEQFFTPGRCLAILAREWPRGISMKAGGHWVLAHRETIFHATSESDAEDIVAKEIEEVSSMVRGMLPLAEALTDAKLVEQVPRYVGLAEDSSKNKRSWWDRLAFVLLAATIAGAILFSAFYLGAIWERFDRVILRTEARRYLFAIVFVFVLWAAGEWLVGFYRGTKRRAATRLEAQYSVCLNRP